MRFLAIHNPSPNPAKFFLVGEEIKKSTLKFKNEQKTSDRSSPNFNFDSIRLMAENKTQSVVDVDVESKVEKNVCVTASTQVLCIYVFLPHPTSTSMTNASVYLVLCHQPYSQKKNYVLNSRYTTYNTTDEIR